MARTAVKESDEIAVPKKDFERAIRIMRHDVKPAEENNAESRGDLSAAWSKIVDECGCNSAAAKVFRKQCLEASEEKKDDFLRTLRGLLMSSGIGISRDLVDQMVDGASPPVIPVELSAQEKADAEFEAAAPKAPRVTDNELDTVVGEMPEGAEPKRARGGSKPKLVTV